MEYFPAGHVNEKERQKEERETLMKRARTNKAAKFFILAVLLCGVTFTALKAHAVFVSPTYIMFEDNQRTARLTLNNRSNQTKVVTFEWQQRAMTEGGKIKEIKDGVNVPGYRPADPYVKFSPRRVVLKPYQYQKIRFILRRPADMAPGEYHSHLLIKEENYQNALVNREKNSKKKGLSGQIILNVYKSIPVFVRHGETNVNVDLQRAWLVTEKGKPHIKLEISNSSTRSIHSQVVLEGLAADGNLTSEKFAIIRIYAEAQRVERSVALRDKLDPARCVGLKAKLIGRYDSKYGAQTLDEADIAL